MICVTVCRNVHMVIELLFDLVLLADVVAAVVVCGNCIEP